MNVEKVVSRLKRECPGKTIILNPPENPTEIVCETRPAQSSEDVGVAIAVIDDSNPHYHRKATEIYEVLKGNLSITINGKEHKLKEGEKITIEPGKIHFAKGNETWVSCLSKPGWKLEDHILVKQFTI